MCAKTIFIEVLATRSDLESAEVGGSFLRRKLVLKMGPKPGAIR